MQWSGLSSPTHMPLKLSVVGPSCVVPEWYSCGMRWYIPKCFLLCGILVIGFGALVPACEAGAGAMK